jgi:hypothetical protein
MSLYILAHDGVVQKYPYNAIDLRRDNPKVSFPASPTVSLLAEWNVFPVTTTPSPNYDVMTQKIIESVPTQINGIWTQVWSIVELTVNEIEDKRQQVTNEIVIQVKERLDVFAQSRGYDNIVSACSYATSQHQKYGPEGRYCVEAREQTWDKLFQILDEVLAGTRSMPTSYDEIETELPILQWPVG